MTSSAASSRPTRRARAWRAGAAGGRRTYRFEIGVAELKERLDTGRGRSSWWTCASRSNGGSRTWGTMARGMIPMREVASRLGEMDPDREIVVYCRSGARSGDVVRYLREQGFARARNSAGRYLAWRGGTRRFREIDPSVPRY
jgi:rhodanese-related sulfurtransferase